MDILTVLEICNALNIDLNDLCKNEVHSIEKDVNKNPFNANLLYLYLAQPAVNITVSFGKAFAKSV